MELFKKKTGCTCAGGCPEMAAQPKKSAQEVDVKILGGGCSKCNQLEKNTIEALKLLQIDTTIEHVTDFSKIASYGVMTTPAVLYNGKVLAYGRVVKTEELVELIQKAR